jgi:2-dehydro-3-deoxy-D-arabinonate dehydratase
MGEGVMAQLVRFFHPQDGARIGVQQGDEVRDVTAQVGSVADWLRSTAGRVTAAIDDLIAQAADAERVYGVDQFADRLRWLAPVDSQDIWGAGVTYQRSREARQEEAIDGGDIYARVYRAERPELFFKGHGRDVIALGDEVGIRADAAWNVPEPELALVMNPALEVVGVTVGNDMSSRDIEGANPLYLPQAKIYTGSCALGPGIVLGARAEWPVAAIRLSIERADRLVFSGETHTENIRRSVPELLGYLGRSNTYPDGVVLLTGTGIIPPPDFTLARGDRVRIAIEGIGELVNTVKVV